MDAGVKKEQLNAVKVKKLAAQAVDRKAWEYNQFTKLSQDWVAEESAVALVYNGISYVVMMASPQQLDHLALGFSLSEGIIDSPEQCYDMEVSKLENGYQVMIDISAEKFDKLKQQRRNLNGRTGCGLCGVESIEAALPSATEVDSRLKFSSSAIQHALQELDERQPLRDKTGAVHAAAWCNIEGQVQILCEDVGRHNALDKVIGNLALKGQWSENISKGFMVVSSRASYEMVSKSAAANVPLLVAVSAPTTLAIDYAQRSRMALVGYAHYGRHVIYTHSERIID